MNQKADMDTNYPEQLGEWVRQQKSTQRDRNLVAFLAIQNEVKAALDVKYSVKTVWKNMQESKRIDVGYEMFLRYVNRLIRHPQANQTATMKNPELSLPPHAIGKESQAKRATPAATATRQTAQAAFVFNPVPPEDKELF